ncbi:hypothetical protein [Kineococcus auxinigenes]|uniref:hypothetical protein n=1 Tax=unclassified Kineococcus TaxID=2621656 RepID=UPI003D7D9B4D
MPVNGESTATARLQDGIDAVLVPRGFSAAQAGTTGERGQIVWCAAADDLAARFPGLPTSREPAGGWSTRCTDVVVDVAGGDWRVTGVSLEGEDLDQVLADLALTAAAERAAALIGSTAHDCLTPLPSLLTELFDSSGPER